ncbi:molybdenum cofactor guanylyltransferase MobA [Parahaliea mediterranea]|uniref:Molybdenum cofactor guanylyltransferase n=1 Tax=Parahaliea mediterranea TaxID=651086 RepID=A0A939IJX8_9GAMM|nr:molybdenum cofactor guanylyltransferase MobA [Parahaliea mediterranea]MBN7798164.1 molybdenum cofactor guanylyltransferase [Parahaliea mediterranea]
MQFSNTPGITGLVLAGGAGRRVGGRDKGMLPWHGTPLAEHVCHRLRPQVEELWISCNRNTDFYARLSDRVFKDDLPGFEGPLAGIATAAPKLTTPLLLVCACDTPRVPVDLASRLSAPMQNPALQLCVAFDGEREQYLAAVLRREALPALRDYLARGERSVRGWYATLRRERVDFSDQEGCFDNINRIAPDN